LPAVILLFRHDHFLAAAGLFLLTALTDCVDGWAARRLNQSTVLGTFLDPVIDKIVILAMFYELAHADLIHAAVPHLFLARELLQNGIRTAASVRGQVVGANWMGKTKAVMQNSLILWGLLMPAVNVQPLQTALHVCTWLVLIVTWGFFGVFVFWNRTTFRPQIHDGNECD